MHAPGRTSPADAIAAAHHVLLSHGRAVEVLRRESPGSRVGVTSISRWPTRPLTIPRTLPPATSSTASATAGSSIRSSGARIPPTCSSATAPIAPPVQDGDLEAISVPVDFLGVNYYQRRVVARAADCGWRLVHQDGSLHTDMGWEVLPRPLRPDAPPPRRVRPARDHRHRERRLLLGARGHDGLVLDPERRDYVAAHVDALGRAIAAGVPVEGYYAWSLLDNFEWAHGYARRFGPSTSTTRRSSGCRRRATTGTAITSPV